MNTKTKKESLKEPKINKIDEKQDSKKKKLSEDKLNQGGGARAAVLLG